MQQTVECAHRTDIGKQSEFLAHCEQTLFGTHREIRTVVKPKVANGGEQHGIRLAAHLICLFWERIARRVNSCGTDKGMHEMQTVSELSRHGISRLDTLTRYFHRFRRPAVMLW